MTKNLPAAPSPQKLAATNRSDRKRVTGKLKIAVEAMVWEGLKRPDAAGRAEMTDQGLRAAMRKGHVLAYYRRELGALREGERARNVHRLVELRDQDENRNAAVKAVQVLEQTDPEAVRRAGDGTSPGIVIRIITPAAQPLPPDPRGVGPVVQIIENEPVPVRDTEAQDDE
jgi:hypothetical protein